MLWFEWRTALAACGIVVADIFTRHTVLVTRYLPALDDAEPVFHVHPYTLVDARRSAVLADAERGVLVVRDATDDSRPRQVGEEDEEDSAALQVWFELKRVAESTPTSDENRFISDFLAALRAHPHHVVTQLVAALTPEDAPAGEADELEAELERARRAGALGDGMERSLNAMRLSAFRTARECLDTLPGGSKLEARAWLLRAIVECVADDMPSQDIPIAFGNWLGSLPASTTHAMDQATKADPEFTERWLRSLPDLELNNGIRRLFHGLPRTRAVLSEREYAVLLFHRAVVAVQLARQLENAGEELAEDGESMDSVLVKLGQPLEDILLSPDLGSPPTLAQDLFAVLIGEEPPSYGRRESR